MTTPTSILQGVGEGLNDLEPFFPERMASRILGLGDVATLLEKAQAAVDLNAASKLGRKMQKGTFDFNDFLMQSQGVAKMGGMQNMLKMMPGMAGKISDEQFFELEKKMKTLKRQKSFVGRLRKEFQKLLMRNLKTLSIKKGIWQEPCGRSATAQNVQKNGADGKLR